MQVHNTVSASNGAIVRAIGLPDLHQGPTGVAILATMPMPKLPGCDIGCGMALFRTSIPAGMARDRVARCMARMDLDTGEHPDDPYFGTIGGGNHFAELLALDPDVPLAPELSALLAGDPSVSSPMDKALLLVHSGSRGHGTRVFAEHSDGHDLDGYMREHEACVAWARRNRAEIACRFLQQFHRDGGKVILGQAPTLAEELPPGPPPTGGAECGTHILSPTGSFTVTSPPGEPLAALVDIAHNWIERLPDGTFLHRKGAAPSNPGSLSLLPGSRATASYVLVCDGLMDRDLCSVAHGAGRRLSRADARRRGEGSSSRSGSLGDLTRGGTIVCESRELLYEEAPYAYKDVEAVVSCMVQRSMCRVGARMLPLATYKTRSSNSDID